MIKADRRILHNCMAPVVLGQLRSARANCDWLLRIYGKGLTKKERAYLQIQLDQLEVITKRIDRVHYRTKF